MLDQLGDAILANPNHALEINGHDLVPGRLIGPRNFEVPVTPQDAGAVVKDIELAKDGHARFDCFFDLSFHSHIAVDERGLAAVLFHEINRFVPRLFVNINDNNPSPFFGKDP